jgi:hypothetical protein
MTDDANSGSGGQSGTTYPGLSNSTWIPPRNIPKKKRALSDTVFASGSEGENEQRCVVLIDIRLPYAETFHSVATKRARKTKA